MHQRCELLLLLVNLWSRSGVKIDGMTTLALCGFFALFPPKARVYVFVLEECPIARKYAPELRRIEAEYGKRGVSFAMVHVDPFTTPNSVKQFQKDFDIDMPQVMDPKQELARKAGITNVPSVAVYVGDRAAYSGRIDDRFPRLGVQRKAPTRKDLRIALDEILAGKPVSLPKTQSIGCALPTL